MSEKINLSINGQCQVPPGFRFHPTEEELLSYYLRKKLAYEKIDLDVIREVDLNKLEPWDIQEKCKIGSTPQNDWYFFSHKDKKYPTGTRTNRATTAGFWKATGRDKIIYSGCKRIGLRKTLVFYKGRAPHGQKSDWIMHEYRRDENHDINASASQAGDSAPEDGWVVCRVFKKKNYLKTLDSPKTLSSSMESKSPLLNSGCSDGVLDQILHYMGRSCKTENEAFTNFNNDDNNIKFETSNNLSTSSFDAMQERFIHLPRLESPTIPSFHMNPSSPFDQHDHHCLKPRNYQAIDEIFNHNDIQSSSSVCAKGGWVAFDRLVASQLNGHHLETPKQLSCFGDQINNTAFGPCSDNNKDDNVQISHHQSFNGENDLWSFTNSSSPTSSDPLCHFSV